MNLRVLFASLLLLATPLAAKALPITGQLDITGVVNVQTSIFQPGGALDFNGNGTVLIATDVFAGLIGSPAIVFDLVFTGPETIYSVGGFSFTANSYFDFDNMFPGRGFSALGFISALGFDDTPGVFSLTTQANNASQVIASFSSSTGVSQVPLPASILFLSGGVLGLGLIGARKKSRRAVNAA